MKIKKLHIKNFKSLVDLEIVEPNRFTVFVGANGVGKSNIFEALEFVNYCSTTFFDSAVSAFGGAEEIANDLNEVFEFEAVFDEFKSHFVSGYVGGLSALNKYYKERGHNFADPLPPNQKNFYPGGIAHRILIDDKTGGQKYINQSYKQFFASFSHLFIKAFDKVAIVRKGDKSLELSGSNLEKVLKRLLEDEEKRDEIIEYLELFIPYFEKVEIQSSELSGTDTLLIYEKGRARPFNKRLISDGTYNILCLLTALYQSDEPQFLCIEEPENGLTPDVIKEMVQIFRNACQEKGHYIWLNTHSQSLVSQLTADELITVDKVNGETKVTQFTGKDFFGLRMDEAWLTNALGSGLPW